MTLREQHRRLYMALSWLVWLGNSVVGTVLAILLGLAVVGGYVALRMKPSW